jgi:hypothetical protein
MSADTKPHLHPPGWKCFCGLRKAGHSVAALGFPCEAASINRFGSRYRLARAFKSVELDYYAPKTAEGYSALFRLFLTWSAFEQFLVVIAKEQKELDGLMSEYDAIALLSAVRKADTNDAFCEFLHGKVNKSHRERLDDYKNGTLRNPTYFASAVRHIFAHGHLGAYADAARPAQIRRVSNLLCDFLITVMDGEFSRHIRQAASRFSSTSETK